MLLSEHGITSVDLVRSRMNDLSPEVATETTASRWIRLASTAAFLGFSGGFLTGARLLYIFKCLSLRRRFCHPAALL